MSRYRTLLLLIGFCLINATAPARGASPESEEKWEVDLELHIWAALPDGSTTGGGGLDFDISELIDELDFLFMGSAGARKV